MDVKTNSQRLLVILLTIIFLSSLGSFFRELAYSKIKVFLSDDAALVSFNKYLYLNLRANGEILEERGNFSNPFGDKKETLNTVSGFDYFIFSRKFNQKLTNGADFRSSDIQQTGSNTISAAYTLTLRKEPAVGSIYNLQVDLPKIQRIFDQGDRIEIQDECDLIIFKQTNQNYKLNLQGLLLDVSKTASKNMSFQLDFQLNCNQ